MEKIYNGCVLLSRQVLENKIWQKSPAYFKIFIYILFKVNYKDGFFESGEGLFNFSEEKIPGCTKTQVYEFLRWAKSDKTEILTTQKTTRGVIIKLNNYGFYQDLNNYKIQNTFQNTPNTQPKHTQHYKKKNKKEKKKTHTSGCVELTNEEKQILLNYAKKSNARNIDAYVNTLIQNGGYKKILEKAVITKEKKEAAQNELKQKMNLTLSEEEREESLKKMKEVGDKLRKKMKGRQNNTI